MVSKLDIPLHVPLVNILRQGKSELSDVLRGKFECEVTISGGDLEGNPGIAQQRWPTSRPQRRFEVTLASGIRVSVWKADLTSFPADAVVNAANVHLQHCGGLALALSKAGGPQIQKESDDYTNMHGALRTGDAVVTSAGSLPCRKIIHAVGPQVPPAPSASDLRRAEGLLESAIVNILARAKENSLSTVAIPAISSGLFGYPLPECADTIVKTVKRSCEYRPGYYPNEIKLVNNDEPTVKEMERACHQILRGAASKSRGDARTSAPPVQVGHEEWAGKWGNAGEKQGSEQQMRYLQQNASHLSITRDDFHGSRASPPQISLSGPSDAMTREAHRWLQGLLFKSFGTVLIRNNFILHFGEQEHLRLSEIMKTKGVSIRECFEGGRASIIVSGDSSDDVIVAALRVEVMLCNIQREFIRAEESVLLSQNTSFGRKAVDHFRSEFFDSITSFKYAGLRVVKVDMVENTALKQVFDLKRQQLGSDTSRTMLQLIPAQFCDMVGRIGFHAEYAPLDDPAYGEGIYFAGTVKKAMEMWKEPNQEYLHFVEAEVLTGHSTLGQPGLILPPAVRTDPLILYDSVSGGPDISVIFSGYQALPKYIITCKSSRV